MKARVVTLRAAALVACLLALGAACSSDGAPTSEGQQATTSTNPAEKPNDIPFDVGTRVGLPRGWVVQITKVHRPSSNPDLPELPDGREYVAVDVAMEYRGAGTETVSVADLFELGDSTGKLAPVVAVRGAANRLDGSYAPQTKRSGRLVFDVPVEAARRMVMDGPQIGTQKAIFMVDPPLVGPGD